jgi:hypothetical protein
MGWGSGTFKRLMVWFTCQGIRPFESVKLSAMHFNFLMCLHLSNSCVVHGRLITPVHDLTPKPNDATPKPNDAVPSPGPDGDMPAQSEAPFAGGHPFDFGFPASPSSSNPFSSWGQPAAATQPETAAEITKSKPPEFIARAPPVLSSMPPAPAQQGFHFGAGQSAQRGSSTERPAFQPEAQSGGGLGMTPGATPGGGRLSKEKNRRKVLTPKSPSRDAGENSFKILDCD